MGVRRTVFGNGSIGWLSVSVVLWLSAVEADWFGWRELLLQPRKAHSHSLAASIVGLFWVWVGLYSLILVLLLCFLGGKRMF